MRVVLVNEGTYPYVTGGVSTWCDQLVRGLPDVGWDLVAIVGTEPDRPAVQLPGNVRSLTPVPIWGSARPARGRPERAAARLCRGMLGDTTADLVVFTEGLRELAELARPRPGRFTRARTGRHPAAGIRLGDILLDAWARARADGIHLPRLTLRDADVAGVLLEHALRPLAAELPAGADLVHANANGLSSMVALAAKWRSGVPFLMTEHGVYLRERYLSSGDQSPGVKTALLRFHRALARLSYWESDLITPVSGFNSRWAVRHGADPAKLAVIGNGVDPARFAPLPDEPDEPVISWVGRVDPLKDLETLIRALGVVRAKVPGARLHLAGPVPAGNEAYAAACRATAAGLGLTDAVTWAGPCASSRDAFAAGQVAALSSISEGMPYTVLEAMMCGRPTVSTDVGGVAEAVGDAGLVVPPRDPQAFGEACVALLTSPQLRAATGHAGRQRALREHTLDRCLSAYRDRYLDLTGHRAAGSAPAADPVLVAV
ncbi:GT4 family glycosyltransferase PelF [Dactylosporangium aurantiacum]|uniref:GT4 family glycosyltransferase PelF n=1 Tax=Dactylosporangium aurantiacum TaxID=35754 RepID=A0A9Q9MN25_9ACTN|nr:GT4 family glycosyltransferase PelF [Dactylosporangium aurantiacum]MDG6100593.1 GT4 family glycosyltransferase PelF [Dactylosporangium aurantiacum]UWZ55317.1 GT4 family glycosyltransferase PelF [Dactylosporangium aurantiacum]